MIKYDDACVGMNVYIPGAAQFGTVIHIAMKGRRKLEVTLLLDSGGEVSYRSKTWFAVMPHEAPARARVNMRAGAALGQERQPAKNPKPSARKPFSIDRQKRPALRSPTIVERGTCAKQDAAWDGPLPDIPGPPVPRPVAGVWSKELG